MASYTPIVDNDELEKRLLQNQIKKTTKKTNYGTTRVEAPQTKTQTSTAFIVNYKHKIDRGETLLGISLKYGVPVELIKRANRLWSNDLAFVKDNLIIPIDREKLKELNLKFNEDDELTNDFNSRNLNQIDLSLKIENANGDQSILNIDGDEKNEAFKSYLNKYDTFINESKIKLKSLETMPNIANGVEALNKISSRGSFHKKSIKDSFDDYEDIFKPNTNGKKNSTIDYVIRDPNENSGEKPGTTSPDLLISSNSNNKSSRNYFNSSNYNSSSSISSSSSSRARLAQENLQRLEREKDDLYEL